MRVIVHGGAGSPPDEPRERQEVLETAAQTGSEVGREASDPQTAVCAAVRVLESDPQFNAGVGGAIQSDGHVRTDAGLMTDDRAVGAACGMPGVEHAVDVARVVKEETPHVLVAGVHAVDLAEAFGVETGVDLDSDRMREKWTELDERPTGDISDHALWVTERFGGDPEGEEKGEGQGEGEGDVGDAPVDRDHDTVGAVATDGESLAAATSTGGRWLALAGRVGDVPQVGSGFYCSPDGGASATGAGEDIARVTLSRRAVQHLKAGETAPEAAERAIEEFGDLVEGSAGIILMTPDGDVGEAYNSDAMQTAVAGAL